MKVPACERKVNMLLFVEVLSMTHLLQLPVDVGFIVFCINSLKKVPVALDNLFTLTQYFKLFHRFLKRVFTCIYRICGGRL